MMYHTLFLAQMPAGAPAWLESFFWVAGGCLCLALLIKELRKKPTRKLEIVDQPITTQRQKEYVEMHIFDGRFDQLKKLVDGSVSITQFEDHREEITVRFNALDKQLTKQVADANAYMHGRFHKLDNDLQQITLKQDNLVTDIRDQTTALNKTGEERITKVHERINTIADTVGEMRGELKGVIASANRAADAAIALTNQRRPH